MVQTTYKIVKFWPLPFDLYFIICIPPFIVLQAKPMVECKFNFPRTHRPFSNRMNITFSQQRYNLHSYLVIPKRTVNTNNEYRIDAMAHTFCDRNTISFLKYNKFYYSLTFQKSFVPHKIFK